MDSRHLSQHPFRQQRVLAISGSLRSQSWNTRLLEAAVEHAPEGMTIRIFDSLAKIPFFDEDLEQAGIPDAVARLRAQVRVADGLLIATPEYNQSVPGVLKNLIDWLSRAGPDEPLARKPTAVVGASSGRWGTRLAQQALRQTLVATESLVMPAPALYLRDAPTLFEAGRLADEASVENLSGVLRAFANWIERNSMQADPARVA